MKATALRLCMEKGEPVHLVVASGGYYDGLVKAFDGMTVTLVDADDERYVIDLQDIIVLSYGPGVSEQYAGDVAVERERREIEAEETED